MQNKVSQSWLETSTLMALLVLTVLLIVVVFKTYILETPGRRSTSASAAAAAVPTNKVRPEPPLPTEPLSLDGVTTKGDPSAAVVIVEFSEFQCPYCGKFAKETLPSLEASYILPGRVQFAFRHLPLEKIHSNAFSAAEAVECAGRQGQFWKMHDLLFVSPKQLSQSDIVGRARTLNLDSETFGKCLGGEVSAKVRADMAAGMKLGVTGTPTFFIGRLEKPGSVRVSQRISGAAPLASFTEAIDKLLPIAAR